MIRIITDSVAGIPVDIAAENNIEIATLFINHDGIQRAEVTMDIDGFYEDIYDMQDGIPTSSQPSQAEFESLFEAAAIAGDEVLGIFLSARFSGTFDGALCCARSVAARHAGFRFCLIDSLSAGFDEAFPVLAAARARDAGCTLEQCSKAAQDAIASSCIIFTPESLRFLQAGGRIGNASALVGSFIKICPLLTVTDGKVNVIRKVRTHKKAVAAIVEKLKHDIEHYGIKSVVVHYIGNPEEAIKWARDVIEPLCKKVAAAIPVSPVLGVHVGPALGISYECEKPLPDKMTPGFTIPVFSS